MEVKGELTTRLTIGFRCHPNYGNDLRKQYVQILSELAASNILADLVTQLTGHQYVHPKPDDLAADILQSDYALS